MEQNNTYAFGPFRLDMDTRLLCNEESCVKLAPKVYRLLLYFLLHSGRLISHKVNRLIIFRLFVSGAIAFWLRLPSRSVIESLKRVRPAFCIIDRKLRRPRQGLNALGNWQHCTNPHRPYDLMEPTIAAICAPLMPRWASKSRKCNCCMAHSTR